MPRPNILFIIADQHNAKVLGKESILPGNADYDMEGKAPHLRRAAESWRKGEWTLFEPRTFEAGRQRKLRVTRYHCVTNRDGKIHPDRLREIAGGNYL